MLKNSKLRGKTPNPPFEYKNSRKNIFSNTRQLINNQVILFQAELLTFTVIVYFEELVNLRFTGKMPFMKEVGRGRSHLFTLQAGDPSVMSTFRYNYMYFKGCINPKVDNDFTYILPVGKGKETKAFLLDYLKLGLHDSKPLNYYSVGFHVEEGDTIFASRRGVVCTLADTTELHLSDYAYSSNENYIEILHKDGTFGRYQVFDKALITEGQDVEAGEPIAIAGGKKYISGPHVRFMVYYQTMQMVSDKKRTNQNLELKYACVPLVFHTKEDNNTILDFSRSYTSDHPLEIITKEMSKKQISRLKKSQ